MVTGIDRPGELLVADRPPRLVVDAVVDKWVVVTVFALGGGRRRHGELGQLIGGISAKVLTDTLRRLERYGLVRREAYAEVPRRVEYELTALGQSLLEPIRQLAAWAEAHGEEVLSAASNGAAAPDREA